MYKAVPLAAWMSKRKETVIKSNKLLEWNKFKAAKLVLLHLVPQGVQKAVQKAEEGVFGSVVY